MKKTRTEIPRPDFYRKEWSTLNGIWGFRFDDENVGIRDKWFLDASPDRKINVPFVYQCEKSGIYDKKCHPVFWYFKECSVPSFMVPGKRLFLNYGAVDYCCDIWINGKHAFSHSGGYVPFSFDVTDFLNENEKFTVAMRVEDSRSCCQPRGKQYWEDQPNRCWYTPSSGIWQPVWLECKPPVFIDRLSIVPRIDSSMIECCLETNCSSSSLSCFFMEVFFCGRKICSFSSEVKESTYRFSVQIEEEDKIDEIHLWTPESPNLYEVEVTLSTGNQSDAIKTYFGMRKVSIENGHVLLNNRPYYQKLVLNQAYWTEGLLTAPNDQAYQNDIELAKKMGFNGMRLHQKIEDPRFYYWADKLGMLVWGEMPSTYQFCFESVSNTIKEWQQFIQRDMNHPCIITWVPLNESWGVRNINSNLQQQEFANTLYHLTKTLDDMRIVSTNDGWEQVTSDLCAIHDYSANGKDLEKTWANKALLLAGAAQKRMIYAEGNKYEGQPILITEFGGIAFKSDMEGHNWGYSGAVDDMNHFYERFQSLLDYIYSDMDIDGFCYTQLSDIMQEVNGLVDMSRKPKVDPNVISKILKQK